MFIVLKSPHVQVACSVQYGPQNCTLWRSGIRLLKDGMCGVICATHDGRAIDVWVHSLGKFVWHVALSLASRTHVYYSITQRVCRIAIYHGAPIVPTFWFL